MAAPMDPERIESIKAGGLSALSGAIACTLLILLTATSWTTGSVSVWITQIVYPAEIVHIAVVTVCAFLFGVTYRYVIRQDRNPHLRSGAVGAFALTRSLSQLENTDWTRLNLDWRTVLSMAEPIVESFGLFLILRLVLDWAFYQQWIQPFRAESG